MRSTTNSKNLRIMAVAVFCVTATAMLFMQESRAKEPPDKPTSLVIITNWGEDTCSLVDISSGKELAKIAVGLKPYDVKVDAKGRFAYVTSSGADYVSVLDIQAMLERKDQRIKVGEGPRDIEMSEDGKRAVVANSGDDSISVVDLVAKKELYRVPVGPIPYGVDLTNEDKLAVITLWGANKVVVVDLGPTSGKIVKTFDVGSLPYTVVVPNKTDYAVVSCFGSHQLYFIDLKQSEVMPPIEVGRSPWGLSASIDGKRVVVANFYSGDASVLTINGTPQVASAGSATRISNRQLFTPSGRPAATGGIALPVIESMRIPLTQIDSAGESISAARPKNAAFTNDPNVAVLTDLGRNEILVLDIAAKKVTKRILVGKAPYGVAFVPRSQ
jgi:YVTN family beta-propeller protein